MSSNLSTSERLYYHSRRKTADTLSLQNQNNDLTEKTTRYDAYGQQITKSKHRHHFHEQSLTLNSVKYMSESMR